MRSRQLLALALVVLTPAAAWSQLPATHLNTLSPPGGKQGATIDVTAAGVNVQLADQLVFSHGGIKATAKTNPANEFVSDPVPVVGAFQVTIAADVPPGVYEARLTGSLGVSNPRAFVVGRRDEIADNGDNRSLEKAQELPLGSTVNGQVDANQFDYYKLTLKKGQRVLAECDASQIDSRLDPVLKIVDAAGKQLALSHDYQGLDGFIDFSAPADGEYLLAIRDFLYGGGGEHYYRLTAHSDQLVDFVFPPAVPQGKSTDVTVYGRNLSFGKPSELKGADGATLDAGTITVVAPGEALPPGGAPLQAAPLRTFRHVQDDLATTLCLAQTDQVVTESADNNTPDKATVVSIPCEAAGQFYPARDIDWFQFEAKKGDVIWIDLISQRLGLDTDPNLVVQRVDKNDKGEETTKEVAFVDDPGDRAGRVAQDFDTSTDDPSYRLAVPDDGLYRVRVTDQFGASRDDPRMLYRLVLRRESPDFQVTAFVRELKVANNNQVPVFAPRMHKGGTCPIQLRVDRLDGFDGDVTVTAEGLPEGVTCHEAILGAQQTTATLMFVCKDDAAKWSGPVSLVAKAQLGEAEAQRPVAIGTVVWGTANRTQAPATFRLAQDFYLSVSDEPAPATVTVGDGNVVETALGAKFELPVKVARRIGHAEPLKLTAIEAANEFKPGDITVNKDQGEGKLAMEIKNGAKPGVYTFFLRSDSKVKYQADPGSVTRAEGIQKKLDEVVKQVAEEVKQKTELAAKAKTDATAAAAETKKADDAMKASVAAEEEAKKKSEAAAAASAEAAKAASEKPDEDGLAQAAKAKSEEAAQAAKALEDASKARGEAATASEQAKAKSDAAAKAQVDADAQLKETQDRSKRAAEAKKKADADVANAKKASAAKDVNFAVYSTPVRIRIHSSPVALSAQPAADLKAGEKVSIPVKLEKKFGFDEAVDITIGLPKGVGGITAAKLQIAKGQAEGMLELTANDKPSAGDHQLTIVAKGKFNNVAIQSESTLTLKVAAAPAE